MLKGAVAASMGPAVSRPDDLLGAGGGIGAVGSASMGPAVSRPDDKVWQGRFLGVKPGLQWGRPFHGRMTWMPMMTAAPAFGFNGAGRFTAG